MMAYVQDLGESIMPAIRIFAVILAAGLWTEAAAAQPAKSLREQLVGTWNFVIAEITTSDGKKTLPFGPIRTHWMSGRENSGVHSGWSIAGHLKRFGSIGMHLLMSKFISA